MNARNHLILTGILIILFSACQSGIRYPDNLPEADKTEEFVNNGITTITFFDRDGAVFRITSHDSTGKPCINETSGAAEIIILKKDQISETTYYDTRERAMINPLYGYARSRRTRTTDGDIEEESFYDLKDKLVVPYSTGYAVRRYEYDTDHNLTRTMSYNAKRELLLPVIVYSYNSDFMNTRVSYVDESGQLMLNRWGYAYMDSEYSGNMLMGYSYHDLNGNPVMVNEQEEYTINGKNENTPFARASYHQYENSTFLRLYDTDDNLIKEIAFEQ